MAPTFIEHVPFERLSTFLREHAPQVTTCGFVLRAGRICRPGTQLDFTVQLVTGDDVLIGRGVVRWAGSERDGTPAMGVEFLELSSTSLRVLDRLLAAAGPRGLSLEPPPPPPGFLHGVARRVLTPPAIRPLFATPAPIEAEIELRPAA